MVSVVIATYNGSKYILLQLNSILSQLSNIDEVIIVDDCSNDDTVFKIKSINDSRIILIQNIVNLGHVKSFEKGIILSKGEIIFLSDQDDFWYHNKVEIMSNYLIKHDLDLLISSYYLSETQGVINETFSSEIILNKSNKFSNLISILTGKNNYFGSLMCFKAVSVKRIMPFPGLLEAHDLFLAFKLNLVGNVQHLQIPLVIRTITGHNLTNPNRNLLNKIRSRIILILCILFSFKFSN